MRILHTETFELHTDVEDTFRRDPRYAILSHRWVGPEISFRGLNSSELARGSNTSPQLDKIRNACRKAREQGLSWLWIDTCCINKESTVEETESINSMFKWYRAAEVCVTYLQDVPSQAKSGAAGVFARRDGTDSEWFRRGWTLQELLAPRAMQFYDGDWNFLGTKHDLAPAIAAITKIDVAYLRGEINFRNASIAQKMSWMADRATTRVEDMAYSLLGIFDTYLVPQYGEGKRAFVRLEKELLSSVPDESLFAWTAPPNSWPEHRNNGQWTGDEWGLLAPSPACFKDSHNIHLGGRSERRAADAFASTRTGVLFPVPNGHFYSKPLMVALSFVPGVGIAYAIRSRRRRMIYVALNCWRNDARGKPKPIQIRLRKTGSGKWIRCECSVLGLADKIPGSIGTQGIPNYKQCDVEQPIIEA